MSDQVWIREGQGEPTQEIGIRDPPPLQRLVEGGDGKGRIGSDDDSSNPHHYQQQVVATIPIVCSPLG